MPLSVARVAAGILRLRIVLAGVLERHATIRREGPLPFFGCFFLGCFFGGQIRSTTTLLPIIFRRTPLRLRTLLPLPFPSLLILPSGGFPLFFLPLFVICESLCSLLVESLGSGL